VYPGLAGPALKSNFKAMGAGFVGAGCAMAMAEQTRAAAQAREMRRKVFMGVFAFQIMR
jgi:hypothetical protein